MRGRGLLFAILVGCYHGERSTERALDAPPPPSAAPDPSAPRLRRLSVREMIAAIFDLTGETVGAADYLVEPTAMGFDNGPSLAMVDTDQAARIEAVAWSVAERVVAARNVRVLAGCGAEWNAACRDAVLDGFGARVARRPLREAERGRLVALYDEVASVDDGARAHAMEAMLAALLQSTAFLYREEIGAVAPSGERRLGEHEIASALSFFVAGSTPDDALLGAAARGELSLAEGREREARRLLATPAGRRQARRFVREWLALDDLATTTKTGDFRLPPALRDAMDAELDGVIDDALGSRGGSLASLFTTPVGLVSSELAPIYGLGSAPAEPAIATLDVATRRGILTRAGFLAVHSAPDNSAPIARGVFVLDAMLCRTPSPPPPGITRVAPVTPLTKTTRQRFAAHTANATCQSCHASIDGVGFGFEEFDPLGQYRASEGGEAVDTAGSVDLGAGPVPFTGVAALEDALLASDALRDCFVKQVVRFATGAPENAATLPAIRALASDFRVDGRIDELAVAIVRSDAFVVRKETRP